MQVCGTVVQRPSAAKQTRATKVVAIARAGQSSSNVPHLAIRLAAAAASASLILGAGQAGAVSGGGGAHCCLLHARCTCKLKVRRILAPIVLIVPSQAWETTLTSNECPSFPQTQLFAIAFVSCWQPNATSLLQAIADMHCTTDAHAPMLSICHWASQRGALACWQHRA